MNKLIPILALFLFCGCSVLNKLNKARAPRVDFQTFRLKALSRDGLEFECVLKISNPNAFELALRRIQYTFYLKEQKVFEAGAPQEVRIPSASAGTVSLPITLNYRNTGAVLKEAFQGHEKLPYRVALNLTLETMLGGLECAVQNQGKLPALVMPKIQITEFKLNALSLTGADGNVSLKVQNAADYEIEMEKTSVALSLGRTPLLSKDLNTLKKIGPGAAVAMTLPFNINFLEVGKEVFTILKGGSAAFNLQSVLEQNGLGRYSMQEEKNIKIQPH